MAVGLREFGDVLDHGFDAVIDVRSPAEFAEDHLPGAINLPVLSDAERARVGTIYKQQSPFLARKVGAALVARNAALHLEGPLAAMTGGWRPLVYCWRGGQRSNSFASILTQVGWRADVIDGGYRRYRQLVNTMLHQAALPHRLILLDGNTGTAKTALLSLLAARGVQVLDLEGLAAHRGSVFGAVAAPQPAQRGFESALAAALWALDPARPVVVEAESSRIGDLMIPPSLWAAMIGAPVIELAAPVEARARYLAEAYADIVKDRAQVSETISLLVPLQGRETVAEWQALNAAGADVALARQLMERHYDPRYAKSRGRHSRRVLARFETEALDAAGRAALADRIAAALPAEVTAD